MILDDFLKMINKFQDFQLVDSQTGFGLTDVTYREGSGEWNLIEPLLNCEVAGISIGHTNDDGTPFIKIMVKDNT